MGVWVGVVRQLCCFIRNRIRAHIRIFNIRRVSSSLNSLSAAPFLIC